MNSSEKAKTLFLQRWGEMGAAWGINKTMAQLHALLMTSERPLCTDDVMSELQISRGNANMNLRALVDWGLARRHFVKGDRKEYFLSEQGVWRMFCAIARERRRREIEPVIAGLEECLELCGTEKNTALFRSQLTELLELSRTIDFILSRVARQEESKILPLLARLVGGGAAASKQLNKKKPLTGEPL